MTALGAHAKETGKRQAFSACFPVSGDMGQSPGGTPLAPVRSCGGTQGWALRRYGTIQPPGQGGKVRGLSSFGTGGSDQEVGETSVRSVPEKPWTHWRPGGGSGGGQVRAGL